MSKAIGWHAAHFSGPASFEMEPEHFVALEVAAAKGGTVQLVMTKRNGRPAVVSVLIMPDASTGEERPRCPDCSGDLGGTALGRLEEHAPTCPRFPL